MDKKVRIKVSDLSFRYDFRHVLKDVSFEIYDKDIITITGPNGGGKSTLLKLILGILKPEKGSIQVDGTDLKKLKSPVLGYVPQYTLFDPKFPITVFETVLSGRIRKGIFLYSDEDRKAASDILDNIGLSEVKNNTFSALSGGQRQRVMIARALAGEPEILLLDEPTTNIDSTTEDYLSSLITELNKDLTIVLVTHDTGFITDFNSRIFCVNKYFHEHPTEKVAIGGGTMKMVRHDIDIHSDIHSGGNI